VVEGGTISFEREKGINELFEDLKDEIEHALKDIREILSYVNDPGGDIKMTLLNLNRLSGELLETRKNIDGLIERNISGTLEGIEALVASIRNEAMPQLASALNTVDSELPGMVDSAGRSLQSIEKITSDIRRASPQVPRIVEEGGELIEGTREVVDSVKGLWPIKSGIKKPREKTLKVDSYE
jgi:phospholipid/cholesterol/gamma-HCH transport system substrate-binding protein